jgi:hypothetical protein
MLWDGNLLELIKEEGRGSPSYYLGWCEIGFFLNQRRNMRMSTTPIYLKEGSPPHSIKTVSDETFPESRKKFRNNHHPYLIKGATIANPPRTMLWDGTFLQPKMGGETKQPTLRGEGRPTTPWMMWGGTLLKPMEKYGNYHHHLKGEKIAAQLLRMVWDATLPKTKMKST